MGVMSLHPKPGAGASLDAYAQFFTNPSYWHALINSLEVTLIVTVVSVLLASPFAWILAFIVPERWQRLALMLAVLPFWTSYVVRSYSWLLVLAEKVGADIELVRRAYRLADEAHSARRG